MKIQPQIKNLFPYFLCIFLFAFFLYGNSIKNNYSLDDEMVTLNNERVEKGIRGISEILRTFHSIDEKSHYEYRPLVLISFAVEFEIFGRNPQVSHFINVIIYSLTCVFIFYLLLILFSPWSRDKIPSWRIIIFPLLATLLFTAHPLHTEVVDNLKSRDELLSLLNSLISIFFFSRFAETGKKRILLFGFLFLLFAILSKRTAIVFIAIIPMSLFFSKNISLKKIFFIGFIAFSAFISYHIFKRLLISEKSIRVFNYFENPLFFEPGIMKSIPAGLYSLWKYFELLIFPNPLSFYYGYNQVPIAGWSHPKVWISLMFHLAIFYFAIKFFKKKHILSFAILFYLMALFPFSNLILPVVGIIGERFTYVASLGFCIALAFLILKLFKIPLESRTSHLIVQSKNALYLPAFLAFSTIILILYSFKTITRNPDWKDHLTLYRHDVKHLGNSAKAHAIISNTIYPELFKMPDGIQKDKLIKECVFHYKKSLEIYPDYITSINNLGSIYFTFLGDYKTALYYFNRAVLLDTNYLEAFYNLASSYEKSGLLDSAIFFFEKSLKIRPSYKPAYDKLYPLYFSSMQYDKAIDLNLRAAANITDLSAMYFVNAGNLYSAKKDTLQALNYFIMAFEKDPGNQDLCTHIAKVYQKIHEDKKAEEYFKKANELTRLKQ